MSFTQKHQQKTQHKQPHYNKKNNEQKEQDKQTRDAPSQVWQERQRTEIRVCCERIVTSAQRLQINEAANNSRQRPEIVPNDSQLRKHKDTHKYHISNMYM